MSEASALEMAQVKRIGQRQKACLFCGAKANSKEDVWPVWILERFTAPTFGLFGTVGDATYVNPTQKAIRLQCVCITCNTGWMSDLEKESGPLLSLMARDWALSLSLEQRILVATWAVKTAMLWEYFAPPERRPYYLEWDRADVRMERRIPENTTVWLARYGGARWLWSSLADATADPRHPMPDTTARAVVTTMVFGCLVLQVMSLRSLMVDARLVVDPIKGPWDQCSVTIWPPTPRANVDWPPTLTLDREVPFHAFRERWPRQP